MNRLEYDVFRAMVHWADGSRSLFDVPVRGEGIFKYAMAKTDHPEVPHWVMLQALVQTALDQHQKLMGCQGGVVDYLVDHNDRRIDDDSQIRAKQPEDKSLETYQLPRDWAKPPPVAGCCRAQGD